MIQSTDEASGARPAPGRPDLASAPGWLAPYADAMQDLFDTWDSVRARNRTLTTYYRMKNGIRDLGISIPPNLVGLNCVVGWADKAVRVMSVRSQFDGYVSGGERVRGLDDLARANALPVLYDNACRSALVHGVSAMTVMRGRSELGQPAAKVRSLSANQCCMLWDKDRGGVGSGVVLSGVDRYGHPRAFVFHFPDAVVTASRPAPDAPWEWSAEANPLGVPLIVPFAYDPDDDRPLGHSRITPEVMGIIDKAMRDVLRMEVGAEFFTAPQRYILGASDELFRADGEEGAAAAPAGDARAAALSEDDGAAAPRPVDRGKMMRAYLGQILAITRDANGDVPQVGQFPAGSADNFIKVFENDAQRFSGATNVPLGQLGVLSNTYTSSDALGAANDPLILEVEAMNRRAKASLELVGRLMLAVAGGATLAEVDAGGQVIAHMVDPSMPTFAARADGWTKIATLDKDLVGTRVWYEGMGLPQETIDRIEAQKGTRSSIELINAMSAELGGASDGRS